MFARPHSWARLTTRRIFHGTRRHSSKRSTAAVVYESTSLNPYFNLAFEDWLFRTADIDSAALLFYRNSPSVIIGRNQNPWKEINFPALRRLGVPFVRRRSGGGTVYHDGGNTNYSVAIPRTSFDRRTNAEVVARGLNILGVPASVNERNDVVVDEFKITYKIASKRAYHHGTMLINAQLDSLGDLLRNRKDTLVTKGVNSVRSPVRNLQDFVPDVTHRKFVDAVAGEFMRRYGDGNRAQVKLVHETDYAFDDVIRKGIEELQSWKWSHGQTPEFTHDLTKTFGFGTLNVHIHSKHGIILDCSLVDTLDNGTTRWRDLGRRLAGLKYGFPDEEEVKGLQLSSDENEVIQWLKDEM